MLDVVNRNDVVVHRGHGDHYHLGSSWDGCVFGGGDGESHIRHRDDVKGRVPSSIHLIRLINDPSCVVGCFPVERLSLGNLGLVGIGGFGTREQRRHGNDLVGGGREGVT